ncbi:Fungal lipase-like domain containing protein [Trema orientale]|uniref:Fungal lipase-like domain containing protein n=1 Tax=Trema orientale TaxID=63057 RepID=A0A2P5F8W1_TREOI|nr:Fungal lipase-like domain containing protein [Trema orientale]
MACKESSNVCHSYLVVKPKEASLIELIRLLFSSDLSKRSFVECSKEEGHEQQPRDFGRRWIIFVSVVAQKALLLLRCPMALLGHVLVSFLNLVAINGGLFVLLRNYLRGEMARPDEASSASIVGNLDWRVELDKNIKPQDEKYNGSLSIMASKLSYENQQFIQNVVQNHWKMQFLGFYNFWNGYLDKSSTQAFMMQDTMHDTNLIVVAFRGTDPFDADAWRTDVDISWYELQKVGKMHGGFVKALALQDDNSWPSEVPEQGRDHKRFAYYELRKILKSIVEKDEKAKFIVTGHSLGGALAILFVAGLAIHNEALLMERLEGVYTFGQPRVGDDQFGKFMKKKLEESNVKYRRYVYSYDLVPRIPYDDRTLLFKHFGPCLYFNSWYKGKILWEEPDKNYFSVIWFMPKYINAVWELIRSFVMPCLMGSEYKEGWFMRLLRVVGLVIPGLAAHCPQDYVNLTRLGSLPSLISLEDPLGQEDSKVD